MLIFKAIYIKQETKLMGKTTRPSAFFLLKNWFCGDVFYIVFLYHKLFLVKYQNSKLLLQVYVTNDTQKW